MIFRDTKLRVMEAEVDYRKLLLPFIDVNPKENPKKGPMVDFTLDNPAHLKIPRIHFHLENVQLKKTK
jgi:hypothetical protein